MPIPTHAYLSTAGSDSFDFNRDGSHFVMGALLVQAAHESELMQLAARIRAQYFNGQPIPQANLAAEPDRQLEILKALREVDFRIHMLVVDKRRLQAEGFRDQYAFYGFLNNLAYQELYKAAPRLSLRSVGNTGFLPPFQAFVTDRHKPDLFGGADFGFSASSAPMLNELSRFLAGTVMQCFDGTAAGPIADAALSILRPMLGSLRRFPEAVSPPEQLPDGRYDAMVAELGLRTARSFIESKTVIGQDAQDQVACARLLLLYFNTYGSDIYLTAGEIMQHLNAAREEALTARQFQTRVIAPLRDAGVLVVSSASGEHKGYKLPSSIADLHKFVSHGKSMIIPLLQRIRIFRETIRTASAGELDILASDEFRELKILADASDAGE